MDLGQKLEQKLQEKCLKRTDLLDLFETSHPLLTDVELKELGLSAYTLVEYKDGDIVVRFYQDNHEEEYYIKLERGSLYGGQNVWAHAYEVFPIEVKEIKYVMKRPGKGALHPDGC